MTLLNRRKNTVCTEVREKTYTDAYKMRDGTEVQEVQGVQDNSCPAGHHKGCTFLVGRRQETGSREQNKVGLEI